MDEKNLIDVSSFMLFEATGDSESDANVHLVKFNEVFMDMAEDDAMSCSYDSSYDATINEYDDSDHGSNYIYQGDNCYVEFRSDDEDEGVVNQAHKMVVPNKLSGAKMAEQQQKSNVCVEKTMKLISQREQDRLFWETCLAS